MLRTIDKDRIKKRFEKSASSYNREAIVQRTIAHRLVQEVFKTENHTFRQVLEIGCGTGLLTQEFIRKQQPNWYLINDLSERMQPHIEYIARTHHFSNWTFIAGDAEKLPFPQDFDLILSSSTFQWFQAPEAFFHSISRALIDEGLLAFSTFGKNNYLEINNICKTGLHYPSVTELLSWLTPYFDIVLHTEEIVPLYFSSPRKVLKHIKQTGVNGNNEKNWSKGDLSMFETAYREKYSTLEGNVTLTYHPIIVVAKKKK